MKGVYIRCVCPYVPLVEELIQWIGRSFYACHSSHIDGAGGYVVEIVTETSPRMTTLPWPVDVYDITCLEFCGVHHGDRHRDLYSRRCLCPSRASLPYVEKGCGKNLSLYEFRRDLSPIQFTIVSLRLIFSIFM